MNDAQLINLLGWELCVRDPSWCVVHDSRIHSMSSLCDEMIDRLDYAEQGMDLVKPILVALIDKLRDEHPQRYGTEICDNCEAAYPCHIIDPVNKATEEMEALYEQGT